MWIQLFIKGTTCFSKQRNKSARFLNSSICFSEPLSASSLEKLTQGFLFGRSLWEPSSELFFNSLSILRSRICIRWIRISSIGNGSHLLNLQILVAHGVHVGAILALVSLSAISITHLWHGSWNVALQLWRDWSVGWIGLHLKSFFKIKDYNCWIFQPKDFSDLIIIHSQIEFLFLFFWIFITN